MTVSWVPVIWVDILGSIAVLVLAALSVSYVLKLRKRGRNQSFYHYLSLLTLIFVIFAISRSFGHLVKQVLYYWNQHYIWELIAPFSGAVNTAIFIIVFSFGVYFDRSRKVHQELEKHRNHLARLVADGTQELTRTNQLLGQEIEERIRTEKELEQNIREFSAVMDGIDCGVLFLDDDLRARIVNRAFRDIWGMDEKFVTGHPTAREMIEYNRYNNVYDITDEDFEAFLDEREAKVLKGVLGPEVLQLKSGKILQYQSVALDGGWRMLTYFDITELKKTEKKLVQSQRMEAMGMMAGGVAHDLNNILSGIVGYPDLLLMGLPEDSEMRQPLEFIKSSGQRAADVVTDMLTVARGAASTREVKSLNTLIIEFLHSPESMEILFLHRDVRVTTDLAPDLLNISCSPVHIQKCLMNLLSNGVEAIKGQGHVLIETTNQYIDKPVTENQYMDKGDYVVLHVSDTGGGIPKEYLSHIFEPFYTKKVLGRSGTGLGLAIVWNTVKEYGGAITVNSSNEGTVFEIFFPVTAEELSEDERGSDFENLRGDGELILIVDDEKQQREIGVQMLSMLGYQVEAVASGEEALAVVEDRVVDLFVLDMIMDPGMNGRETYEQIVKIRPGQRALIVSGFSENEEVQRAQKLGAGQFVRKPYTIEQIGSAVKKGLQVNSS
jgi:signal transduction histidine kinase/ActR/RegA family two-component response regulator